MTSVIAYEKTGRWTKAFLIQRLMILLSLADCCSKAPVGDLYVRRGRSGYKYVKIYGKMNMNEKYLMRL